MQTIKIITHCGYEWETSISDNCSVAAAHEYFLNKPFNVGSDTNEKIVYPKQILFKGLDY